ncbi:MAG: crossover junction endodeoxyribonuclease RuvC [Verrucomicrobia bacterium]|nr:crossover junction endodeoxyribonuclease RuvC [Verrucomicrobiota bacterium]
MTNQQQNRKIIIGIDPGTRVTGYGVISITGRDFMPLDFGCIRPPATLPLGERYAIIFNGLQKLLESYNPLEMAIETPFVHKNAQSAMKLGIAMGCALIVGKLKGLKVFGYSPREVKCAIVGTGKASKEQVQRSITNYLSLKSPPTPQDAADALAIAICHANSHSLLIPTKKEL